AAAAVQAIANGLQAAIMAPTEILAEQHYKGLRALLGGVRILRPQSAVRSPQSADAGALQTADRRLATGDWKASADAEQIARLDEIKRLLGMMPEDDLDGQGVRVALLTGSLGAKDRRKVLEAIASGDVDLVVGTHALITESVRYAQLGLVVVDEQH